MNLGMLNINTTERMQLPGVIYCKMVFSPMCMVMTDSTFFSIYDAFLTFGWNHIILITCYQYNMQMFEVIYLYTCLQTVDIILWIHVV